MPQPTEMITDCHVHIAPLELFKPEALALEIWPA
jgi:hypothetical protein